jgi:putative hemolysin
MLMFWLEVLLIFVLMLLSGFFAASEIGVIAVRRSRIAHLARQKDPVGRQARFVQKLHSNPDRFFAIIQIGITVTGSAASAVGGAIAVQLLKPIIAHLPIGESEAAAESIALTIVIVIISYLFLVIAELLPKALAIRFSEKIALFVGAGTYYSLRFTRPVINILTASTNLCLKLLRVNIEKKEHTPITEAEVKLLLAEGLKTGTFLKTERDLINGVFDFADTVARQVMTPRTDIEGIEINEDPEDILSMITASRFSRFPVYEESLDQIIGIIHARDVIGILREKNLVILKDILRKPYFIPDSKPLIELLRDFQKNQSHMAIVLDEFGGTAGLVTLEDLLEEIVGEIQDEYDKERQQWSATRDGSFSVAAEMAVEDFNDQFKADLEPGLADTVAGYVIHQLGRLPRGTEAVEAGGYKYIVTERMGNRIKRLRVTKLDKPADKKDAGKESGA